MILFGARLEARDGYNLASAKRGGVMTESKPDLKAKFVVDERGRKTAAVLDMRTYRRLLAYLEELEDRAALAEIASDAASFRPYEVVRKELKKTRLL